MAPRILSLSFELAHVKEACLLTVELAVQYTSLGDNKNLEDKANDKENLYCVEL